MTPFVPSRRKMFRMLAAAPLLTFAAARLAPRALAASTAASDAAVAADSTKAGPSYRVEIQNFTFAPNEITVPVGARIVWTNRDEEPHQVVSAAGAFKASPGLDTNDSFSAVLTQPGTYAYFCGIHPMMVGKIIVR
jgi:plastocyanin